LQETIPAFVERYTEKNALIDECDELFDKNEADTNKLEALIKEKIAKLDAVLAKIHLVSPLQNPALPTDKVDDFIVGVAEKLERANKLKIEFDERLKKQIQMHDKLMEDINPLNELGEREVK